MPKGIYPRATDKQRFWAKVNKDGPMHPVLKSKCWLWTGATLEERWPYGIFKANGRGGYLAHRYSYEIHVGQIPDGLNVCHHCDNPSCVNPIHLFVGNNASNAADRDSKGRQVIRRGEEFTHAKLTDEIVREIRRRYIPHHPKHGACAMGREFGVSKTVVRWVISRRIWKHVT